MLFSMISVFSVLYSISVIFRCFPYHGKFATLTNMCHFTFLQTQSWHFHPSNTIMITSGPASKQSIFNALNLSYWLPHTVGCISYQASDNVWSHDIVYSWSHRSHPVNFDRCDAVNNVTSSSSASLNINCVLEIESLNFFKKNNTLFLKRYLFFLLKSYNLDKQAAILDLMLSTWTLLTLTL